MVAQVCVNVGSQVEKEVADIVAVFPIVEDLLVVYLYVGQRGQGKEHGSSGLRGK